jgi:hypothetical protein
MKRATIVEASKETPVKGKTDVLVVGGGPAGIGAAIAAARLGVDVLLVERYGCLGGMATGGLIGLRFHCFRPKYIYKLGEKLIQGIPLEVVERATRMGAAIPLEGSWIDGEWIEEGYPDSVCDPEALKGLFVDMVEETKAKILLHSWAVDAVVEDGVVRGAVFESKSGRFAVLAKVVVDATGDADIAAYAGAPFETSPTVTDASPYQWLKTAVTFVGLLGGIDVERVNSLAEDGEQLEKVRKRCREQGLTFNGKPIPETVHGEVYRNVNFNNRSAIDVDDLTFVEIEGRKRLCKELEKLRSLIPGYERAYLQTTASQTGVRASRRIIGEYVLNEEDYFKGKNRKFKDLVVRCAVDIPYRCLIPRAVENLLVAGRCISTTFRMLDSFRTMVPCMALGQAAGAAAALSILNETTPRALDVELLRETLIEQRANL